MVGCSGPVGVRSPWGSLLRGWGTIDQRRVARASKTCATGAGRPACRAKCPMGWGALARRARACTLAREPA
jgi:hypothetical protein